MRTEGHREERTPGPRTISEIAAPQLANPDAVDRLIEMFCIHARHNGSSLTRRFSFPGLENEPWHRPLRINNELYFITYSYDWACIISDMVFLESQTQEEYTWTLVLVEEDDEEDDPEEIRRIGEICARHNIKMINVRMADL